MTPCSHDALQADLARWLSGRTPRPVVEAEIALAGTYGSAGRVDVAAVAWGKANRPVIDVYEVKASSGDLGADLTAVKWERYLPQCHRLWFASPAGVVAKADVPEGVGLIVRADSGVWRTVVRPKHREMGDRALVGVLARMLRRRDPDPPVARPDEEAERRERRERWASFDDEQLALFINGRVRDMVWDARNAEARIDAKREHAERWIARREADLAALEARLAGVPATLQAVADVLDLARAACSPRQAVDSAAADALERVAHAARRRYTPAANLVVFS
jgi:hypothetical protein